VKWTCHRKLVGRTFEHTKEVGAKPSLGHTRFVAEVTKAAIAPPLHFVRQFNDLLRSRAAFAEWSVLILDPKPKVSQ
jgi:hypothetical protein